MTVIVWDRDDVLVDSTRHWLEDWWKPAHPECQTTYRELKENPPHRILGIGREKYLASLDRFRLSPQAAAMEPIQEVLDWFGKFGHKYRHFVLTATSLDTAAAASAWTFRHFGAWVRSFHLAPSTRERQSIPAYDSDKASYIRSLGRGDILIDDSIANIEAVERLGLEGVLFPQPWNSAESKITKALERLSELVATGKPHMEKLRSVT